MSSKLNSSRSIAFSDVSKSVWPGRCGRSGPVTILKEGRHYWFVMSALTATERMTRFRYRRRRGLVLATVRVDSVGLRKLVALGYLRVDVGGDNGAAFDAAVETYLSDKLVEESVAVGAVL